jgi:hypothetical protein
MDKIIALFVFGLFYELMYLIPVGILIFLGINLLSNDNDLEEYIEIVQVTGALIFICFFMLAGYRAKLAAEAYDQDEGIGFRQAHTISGAILKANLSFLPNNR